MKDYEIFNAIILKRRKLSKKICLRNEELNEPFSTNFSIFHVNILVCEIYSVNKHRFVWNVLVYNGKM